MAIMIAVYGDWDGLPEPLRLGRLHANRTRGREVFEFEFEAAALESPALTNVQLDPRLGLYEGRQHPGQGSDTFGAFADASPDRWGRLLMQRRLEREQRAGHVARGVRLYESDYLLGVHDAFRVGALRFRLDDAGEFLDDRHEVAAPPFVSLRELEAASLAIERDEDNTEDEADAWLRMLIAPGGSLGGARPKASVVDPNGHLWIAKCPSVRDEHDVGAWELVVQTLAVGCGLRVSESQARRFAHPHHTFLVRRFDHTDTGQRLHFASAMTLTGHKDGDDASAGTSYLEIARVLMDHGAQTNDDLRELWSRIVFNVLVSNTDDHLRNHGFTQVPGKGWRLSEAFDMNPAPGSFGLTLNISETDNSLEHSIWCVPSRRSFVSRRRRQTRSSRAAKPSSNNGGRSLVAWHSQAEPAIGWPQPFASRPEQSPPWRADVSAHPGVSGRLSAQSTSGGSRSAARSPARAALLRVERRTPEKWRQPPQMGMNSDMGSDGVFGGRELA